jgi:tRNA nucleotidyltransferase (CCA-adding enzyme)
MQKNDLYQKIHLKVLERVRPTKEQERKMKEAFSAFKKEIHEALKKKEELKYQLELAGSFSRETWLAGKCDFDIFLILPRESPYKLEKVLEIVKKGMAYEWKKKHAKHPYLYTEKEGLEYEIVPSYEYSPGKEIKSAVDRSIAHKHFVVKYLKSGLEDEVRLLKQFMRGIGVYGAEIKIEGFSGYLAELLIIHYGSFIETLEHAKELPEALLRLTKEPKKVALPKDEGAFIFIDPTDPNRNVAAAVSQQSLEEFIAAATIYLEKPSIKYFFPPAITKQKAKEIFEKSLVLRAIKFTKPEIVDDVLWGQIGKFERSLQGYLKGKKVKPLGIKTVTKENSILTVIITEKSKTPFFERCEGPPVGNGHQQNYLKTYLRKKDLVYGPRIANGHWEVVMKRKQTNVEEVIRQAITKKKIALPSYLQKPLESATYLGKESLLNLLLKGEYEKQRDKICSFIEGKPPYL